MKIAEDLARLLRDRQLTMGTAESCTGGRIASVITSRAGSSAYFKGGIVAYCNEVKHEVLGVSAGDLSEHGAVSRPVVEQMALGATHILKCDCAVATSGIAGPDGAVPGKPVGTVWIAAAYHGKVASTCCHFTADRLGNIEASAEESLKLLYKLLNENRTITINDG